MLRRSPALFVLAAALLLSACGSADRKMPVADILKERVKQIGKEKPDTAGMRRAVESLSREQLIGVATDPLILVDVEASDTYATLNQISQNGAYAIFFSGDQKTLTFTKGLLTATRGLGADLMSSDLAATSAAPPSGCRRTTPTATR